MAIPGGVANKHFQCKIILAHLSCQSLVLHLLPPHHLIKRPSHCSLVKDVVKFVIMSMFVNCSLSCYFLSDLLFAHLVRRNPHLYFFVFVQTLQLSVGFGFHLPRESECWELAAGNHGCFLQLFGNLLPTLAGLEAEGAFRQLPLLLLDTGLALCLPPLPCNLT